MFLVSVKAKNKQKQKNKSVTKFAGILVTIVFL